MSKIGALIELNVKPGDMVLHVESGVLHTVFYVFEGCSGYRSTNGKWLASNDAWRIVSRSGHNKLGPVRTVTRRDVVPGIYGRVCVEETGVVSCESMRSPAELRAAAATLTEIADALAAHDQRVRDAALDEAALRIDCNCNAWCQFENCPKGQVAAIRALKKGGET
jgi:hypothetical protein